MSLNFTAASGITVDGLTLGSVTLAGSSTRNNVIKNSDVGCTSIQTASMANSNNLLEGNQWINRNADDCSQDGRISLPNRNEATVSGVTIRGNLFSGGDADGILNGSNGTIIESNRFFNLEQASSAHTDSIQLFGSKNTIVRKNFFRDVSICIMAPDEADHELIEDNVCVQGADDGGGINGAIQLGSDNGSIIRHNTFYDVGTSDCDFNLRCGKIQLGHKSADDVSVGTQIYDNIVNEIGQLEGTQTQHHNLFTQFFRAGTGNIQGMPTYVNSSPYPALMSDYRLAPFSLGKGAASDGLDMGARFP